VWLRLAMTHTQNGTRTEVFSRVLQCVVASRNDLSVVGDGDSVLSRLDDMPFEGEGGSIRQCVVASRLHTQRLVHVSKCISKCCRLLLPLEMTDQ